jgi:hypothetical protein
VRNPVNAAVEFLAMTTIPREFLHTYYYTFSSRQRYGTSRCDADRPPSTNSNLVRKLNLSRACF